MNKSLSGTEFGAGIINVKAAGSLAMKKGCGSSSISQKKSNYQMQKTQGENSRIECQYEGDEERLSQSTFCFAEEELTTYRIERRTQNKASLHGYYGSNYCCQGSA